LVVISLSIYQLPALKYLSGFVKITSHQILVIIINLISIFVSSPRYRIIVHKATITYIVFEPRNSVLWTNLLICKAITQIPGYISNCLIDCSYRLNWSCKLFLLLITRWQKNILEYKHFRVG
jgi:hypothetical protein